MTSERDLPELDAEIRALLSAEAMVAVPADAKVRVLARVLESLPPTGGGPGSGDPGPGAPSSPAPALPGPGTGSLLASTKLIAAAAFAVGTIAGATAVTVLEAPPPPPQIIYVERPAPPPPSAPPPRPPPKAASRPDKPKADPKPPADVESREQALIERARTALGRKQPSDALSALEEHRRDFASGRFVEEREALLALALWSLDRKDEAKAQAARFKARYPQSLLGPTIDSRIR